MSKIKSIYDRNIDTKVLIDKNILSQESNKQVIDSANQLVITLDKVRDLSTEFEYMNIFENDDGEIDTIYKQWNVIVFITPILEDNINFFLSSVDWEIIFKEPEVTIFTYYNSQDDIHKSCFSEIRENMLVLKPSVRINKAFGGSELLVPQVQLKISIKNGLKIIR
jgi:hypothetical protein